MVLATKGRFPDRGRGPNEVGLSRRHLARALDASACAASAWTTIDLYQVHAWDPCTPLEETLRFLDDAVRAGKIHYVGLSNFTGWQIQKAVDIADVRGLARPVTLQPQYNLLAREVEWEIVPACEADGLGLLPWSPLGGGWLTGKYRRDAGPPGDPAGREPGPGRRGLRPAQRRGAHLGRRRRRPEGRRGPWCLDGPGRARLAARPARRHLGDPRLPHGRSAPTTTWAQPVSTCRRRRSRRLDAASEPGAADYPYGGPGSDQRSRKIDGDV